MIKLLPYDLKVTSLNLGNNLFQKQDKDVYNKSFP